MDRGFITAPCCSTPICRLANYLNPDQKSCRLKALPRCADGGELVELLPGITHQQVCEAIQKHSSAITANGWTPR